ncbi:MAG: DUF1801 domain-containing protein [Jatrophihabitans sp.]|uniref:DUF1801 domain-containing protein n=1 Tax=Jatrophihabitans sp. TaxID=1932789 RepID=UPI003F7F54F1
MPKQIKGNPRRKPPDPTPGHEVIGAWFADVAPRVRPLVSVVDEAVRETLDGLEYAVKFHRAFYGLPDLGWVIEVAPYQLSANILFLGGADFDPVPPLGDVGRSRYVKIRSADEVTQPQMLDWIAQAGRTPGWR